jgi:integrase
MSDDNVERFVEKYADAARNLCTSIPGKVTPHMFRHSRALALYRNGMPLPLISEWLGHSHMETTLVYYDKQAFMESKHDILRKVAILFQNS